MSVLKFDTEEMMARLKGESDNGPRTLYFNNNRYQEFQKVCEKMGLKPSAVLDDMIRQFLVANDVGKNAFLKDLLDIVKSTPPDLRVEALKNLSGLLKGQKSKSTRAK